MERVLIIDSDELSIQRLRQILGTQDYHIDLADSEEASVALIGENLPDIILIDAELPGQDGVELCRNIKENDKLKMIPIIFVTALEDTVHKVRAFNAGASDYVTKPFKRTEVLARVKSQLKIRRMESELFKKERQLGFSALIVTLNHNINNALGALPLWKMYAKKKKDSNAPKEDIEMLDEIIRQIDYIVKILRKITVLSRQSDLDRIKYTEYLGKETMIELEGL